MEIPRQGVVMSVVPRKTFRHAYALFHERKADLESSGISQEMVRQFAHEGVIFSRTLSWWRQDQGYQSTGVEKSILDVVDLEFQMYAYHLSQLLTDDVDGWLHTVGATLSYKKEVGPEPFKALFKI